MGKPPCRKCDTEKETPVHILCVCLELEEDRTKFLRKAQMDLGKLKEVRLNGIMHCFGQTAGMFNAPL